MPQIIRRGLIHPVGVMTFSLLLLSFSAGCGDSSVSGNTTAHKAKPVQEVKKAELSANDLMKNLTGNWKNDGGDSLAVTDTEITYCRSGGNEGAENVKYKLKGIENALPDAIRIELGGPGMPREAVAVFNDVNHITFGVVGEMPVKFIRK
jgi:hypothetical protein